MFIFCSARSRPPRRSSPPPREAPKGLHLQLIPIYGVTIPVIVRLGNLQATAGIANVELEKRDGKPAVGLDLSRSGTRSTFGEVRVYKAGVKDPIAVQTRGRGLHRAQLAPRRDPDRREVQGRRRGPGDRPIFRNLRRRARRSSPKPKRCSAKSAGPETRDPDRARRPQVAAQGGAAAGGLRRRRRRVGSAGAAAAQWTADPDDQFLLDVNIRQLRLGDGVRAYNTPEGTCVVLGDFLSTLDVPMRIDLAARRRAAGRSRNRTGLPSTMAPEACRTAPRPRRSRPAPSAKPRKDGASRPAALSRWFGIGVQPMTSGSVLLLQSDAKLPVELAMERQLRAQRIQPAKFDLASLPQVRIPYRMWRSPALDFVVSAGVTYRAKDGMRVDRQSSIYAAGEIAHLSYDAQISTDQKGMPSALRLRAYRSDPDGHLLGPAHATHFGVGDVEGFDSKLERLVGVRPRGRDHQPAAERADGVRPFALRRRSAARAGKPKSTATTNSWVLPRRPPTTAMSLTTCSSSTAKTGCAWCFTDRRGRSGRARN